MNAASLLWFSSIVAVTVIGHVLLYACVICSVPIHRNSAKSVTIWSRVEASGSKAASTLASIGVLLLQRCCDILTVTEKWPSPSVLAITKAKSSGDIASRLARPLRVSAKRRRSETNCSMAWHSSHTLDTEARRSGSCNDTLTPTSPGVGRSWPTRSNSVISRCSADVPIRMSVQWQITNTSFCGAKPPSKTRVEQTLPGRRYGDFSARPPSQDGL